ncbi:PIHD2 protein, partial [Eudromia elegans]|nr:PIHD2 protein [Eudromia elegans]
GAPAAPLFVNVCAWSRIPAPRAPAQPLPVGAGPLQDVAEAAEHYSVIDVAYNPDVLQRAEEDREEMEHLIHLTLKFVEERCGLTLSRSYTIETFKVKGSLERLQRSLRGEEQAAAPPSQTPGSELTLAELLHSMEVQDSTPEPVLLQDSVKQDNMPLIEEITSTELPEEPSTPLYEMLTVKDANERPVTIELKIELPQVSSVSECDLSISKDDIIIEVSGKYKLELHLPELVDEETTTAVFSKGKRILFITMPIAQPED